MYPPVFTVCSANAGVQAALGTNPTRLYPFGTAVQRGSMPFCVWQVISGDPENYINQVPDIDQYTIQFDCYATTATGARDVAEALRDSIEPVAHVVSWRGEDRDNETKLYRYAFDVDWFVHR